jgi:hypothetical protein
MKAEVKPALATKSANPLKHKLAIICEYIKNNKTRKPPTVIRKDNGSFKIIRERKPMGFKVSILCCFNLSWLD